MNDRNLLGRLAVLFDRHDPVPDAVTSAAESAFGHGGDQRVLALVGGAGGLRGDTAVLGFAGHGCRVDVTVEEDGEVVRLTGLAEGGPVRVRWPGGERAVAVDDVGRFSVTGLPPGPLSVVVRDVAGPWFVG